MKKVEIKPELGSERATPDEKGKASIAAAVPDPAALSKKTAPRKGPKRRTKTGCLTCRSRRIKCGEERPICNNCIKSKRICEGYAPRVVFKHHLPAGGLGSFNANRQSPAWGPGAGSYGVRVHPYQIRPDDPGQRILATRHFSASGQSASPEAAGPQIATIPSMEPSYPYSHEIVMKSLVDSRSQAGSHLQWQAATSILEQERRNASLDISSMGYHPYAPPHLLNYVVPPGLGHQSYSMSQRQPYSYTPSPTQSFPPYLSYSDENDGYYYDVDSDDELLEADDIGSLGQMASGNWNARQTPTFTAYTNDPKMLASYYPFFGCSLLNNAKAVRLFFHFRCSLGPFMSVFERCPADPIANHGGSVSTSLQSLWTDTLPLKALEHPALIRAMLAMSCLNISILQQSAPSLAMKHYHYALRKVRFAIGLPLRRRQICTLAAILALGYYEVMAADHPKWCNHLAGSAQLIREIDFASMTRDLRAQRRRVLMQRKQILRAYGQHQDAWSISSIASEEDPFADEESGIDEDTIELLLGRAVDYDTISHANYRQAQAPRKFFTPKDIEDYRIQCDLYWLFCKNDVFQSMVSGNQLLLPYEQWGQCPPRAGIGKLDAIYGSADHLWLLLGRLQDFGYRDRKRKLRLAKATGKDWAPSSGFFRFMARFSQRGPSMPQIPSVVLSDDEQAAYDSAEEEWESIRSAFEIFLNALGSEYMPLSPDKVLPMSTPFGPALRYLTDKIAVIWTFYYCGRILLHRLHPSMPPAMMVAAGVCAPTTAEYAQLIGNIMAGVCHHPLRHNLGPGSLDPTMSACLTEMTVAFFIAAVQYTDFSQRNWAVTSLHDIGRLTGWGTAYSIAAGCEKTWTRAAENGKGPPYRRSEDHYDEGSNDCYQEGKSQGKTKLNENPERRWVAVVKPPTVPWALGVMGLEDDMTKLDLRD